MLRYMCWPECGSVINLTFSGTNIMVEVVLIEIRGVNRELKFSIPECCNGDTNEVPSRSIGCSYFVAIYRCAYIEYKQWKHETSSGDTITESPSQVLLNVYQSQTRNQSTQEWSEHPPVEERGLKLFLVGVEVIKLVGTEGWDVGFCSACSNCHCVKGCVEKRNLWGWSLVAYAIAARWSQPLQWHCYCQKCHTLSSNNATSK